MQMIILSRLDKSCGTVCGPSFAPSHQHAREARTLCTRLEDPRLLIALVACLVHAIIRLLFTFFATPRNTEPLSLLSG